jgi:hypothetical protein
MCRFSGLDDDNFEKVQRVIGGYVCEIEIDSRIRPGRLQPETDIGAQISAGLVVTLGFCKITNTYFLSDPLQPNEVKVWGDLPRLTEYFTGRREILSQVHQKFSSTHQPSDGRNIVALYGLGGAGKSTVALAYASENRDRYTAILWINASSRAETMNSYVDCAQMIKARDTGIGSALTTLSKENPTRFVKEWLAQRRSKWLIVFDGLDEPGLYNDYDWFIPRSGVGDILVTSRQETCQNLGSSIAVADMPQQDAVQLLLRIILGPNQESIQEQRDQAAEIATYLGFLPL